MSWDFAGFVLPLISNQAQQSFLCARCASKHFITEASALFSHVWDGLRWTQQLVQGEGSFMQTSQMSAATAEEEAQEALAEGRDNVWGGNTTVAAGSFTYRACLSTLTGCLSILTQCQGPQLPSHPFPSSSAMDSHAYLHMSWVSILQTTPEHHSGLAASVPRSS